MKRFLKQFGKVGAGVVIAAGAGGAAAVTDAVLTKGEIDPQRLGGVAIVGAITGVTLWLKQSPLEQKPEKPAEAKKVEDEDERF